MTVVFIGTLYVRISVPQLLLVRIQNYNLPWKVRWKVEKFPRFHKYYKVFWIVLGEHVDFYFFAQSKLKEVISQRRELETNMYEYFAKCIIICKTFKFLQNICIFFYTNIYVLFGWYFNLQPGIGGFSDKISE